MSSFSWFMACRYLRAKRKQKFISLITLISILGVAVGVMALIIVLSVFTGFTEGLRDQIIGVNSHVVVQRYSGPISDLARISNKIMSVPGVVASTPYINGQALINSPQDSTGVIVRGIDAVSAAQVLTIGDKMKMGKLSDLDQPLDVPPIIIGSELAQLLRVGIGDRLRLIAPNGPLSPMGVLPKVRTCTLVGIFTTGMQEYDSNIAFLNMDTARSLMDLHSNSVHGIELKVRDVDQADRIGAEVGKALGGGYSVRAWMELNEHLFAALKLEKFGIFLALNLIILVAALNIISALAMMVMEKNRDIAILKSMGATTRSIMRIFLYQGLVIGLSGTLIGLVSGLGLCGVLKHTKIIELPPNVYPMSTMPIKVVPLDVGLVLVSALLITLVATLYPSWKASCVRPAEALSYE